MGQNLTPREFTLEQLRAADKSWPTNGQIAEMRTQHDNNAATISNRGKHADGTFGMAAKPLTP